PRQPQLRIRHGRPRSPERRAWKRLTDVPRGTLLSQAEAAEKRIEHVLDTGTAGQPVEGPARRPQILSQEQMFPRERRSAERCPSLLQMRRLAPVQRDCILCG